MNKPDEKTVRAAGCEYCGEGWKPLFRIIDSYPYDEIDVHGECGTCEHVDSETDAFTKSEWCKQCEFAPVAIHNKLNLTVFVNGKNGNIVFEDKVNDYEKYHKEIHYCPMCGAPLSEEAKARATPPEEANEANEALTKDDFLSMVKKPVWTKHNGWGVLDWRKVNEGEYRMVVGFPYGWEWLEDVMRCGPVYRMKEEEEANA